MTTEDSEFQVEMIRREIFRKQVRARTAHAANVQVKRAIQRGELSPVHGPSFDDIRVMRLDGTEKPRLRPPGTRHCGHWQEGEARCCGCNAPVLADGETGPAGPCPGGMPYC